MNMEKNAQVVEIRELKVQAERPHCGSDLA
jgi:hypothetical protein